MEVKLVGFKKSSKSKPPKRTTTATFVLPLKISPYRDIYTPLGIAVADILRKSDWVVVKKGNGEGDK
ncbi:hypothetical protein ES705_48021 [subsurface metagenome]